MTYRGCDFLWSKWCTTLIKQDVAEKLNELKALTSKPRGVIDQTCHLDFLRLLYAR